MQHLSRIISDPNILHGKPIIKGTRIPIDLILKMLAQGINFTEILNEYPDVTKEDILAVLAYAQETVSAEEIHSIDFKPLSV